MSRSDQAPGWVEYTGPQIQQSDPVLSMELLREYRDRLLKESDVYMLPDYPHRSKKMKEAWAVYRQQLRDLPSISTPSINADRTLNLESVRFPTPPS